MKCLIVIPHIFEPKSDSLYSSQNENKRKIKLEGIYSATIENIERHKKTNFIHASLGNQKPVVTREMVNNSGIDIYIQIYTKKGCNLIGNLESNNNLEAIYLENVENIEVPDIASRRLLEQSDNYDILGYMEDDILIEDPEFFQKIIYFHEKLPKEYAVIPHRCEHINGRGDVILSGDPDGGRPDLFWDTNEHIRVGWSTGEKILYRATNPHSGCFFLSRLQAKKVQEKWEMRNWMRTFQLSGPLEQAASGRLLETLKVMKPKPSDYRFFMVRHRDNLWIRHPFEK